MPCCARDADVLAWRKHKAISLFSDLRNRIACGLKKMASRIEDYALIGDCETAALVARDGSIDWLCVPRFDSDACFAALLGDAKNGRWLIAPEHAAQVSRTYRGDTLILETTFKNTEGSVRVTD